MQSIIIKKHNRNCDKMDERDKARNNEDNDNINGKRIYQL